MTTAGSETIRSVWLDLERLLHDDGRRGTLVTVLRTEGSAYQREGAKLLLPESGEPVGTISGGCLETDVYERCRQVMRQGTPCRAFYDTGDPADALLGTGTGCGGKVEMLIEPLERWRSDVGRALLDGICRRLSTGERSLLATILTDGSASAERALFARGRKIAGSLGDPSVERRVAEEAAGLLEELRPGRSRLVRIPSDRGEEEVFLDVVEPPIRLIVFGAGEDARPLVRLAAELGMAVTVVDWREGLLSKNRFPEASGIVCARGEDLIEKVCLEGRPAIVLMTHNYPADLSYLDRILSGGAAPGYLGILGPVRRTERLLEELAPREKAVDASRVQQIRAPVGLDLGAESPEEIALSIVAEVLAVARNRRVAPLSEVKKRREPSRLEVD